MTNAPSTGNVVQFPGDYKPNIVEFPGSRGDVSAAHEWALYKDLGAALVEHVDNRRNVSAMGAIGVLHMLAEALREAYMRSLIMPNTDGDDK